MNIELQSMAIDLPRLAGAHPNRAPFRGVLTLVDTPSDRPPSGARGHRVVLTRAAAEQALPSLLGMGLDFTPLLDRHDIRRKVGIITEANVVARVAQGFSPANKDCLQTPALAAEGFRMVRAANTSGAKAQVSLAAETAGLKPCSTQITATGRRPLAHGHRALAAGHRPPATDHSRSAIEIAGYLYARDFPDVMRELRGQCGPGLRPGIAGQTPAPCSLGMSYEITDARIDDLRAAIWTVSECTFTGAAILRRDKAAYRDTWIELL